MADKKEQAIQLLKGAKRLLIEKGWTRHHYARNKDGKSESVVSSDAQCFCSVGALAAVARIGEGTIRSTVTHGETPFATAVHALAHVVDHVEGEYKAHGRVTSWNDSQKDPACVTAKFDEAVSYLSK